MPATTGWKPVLPIAMIAYLLENKTFHPGAALPLTDRGFRYGMSVFETIAIRASTPLLFESHLGRLVETAAAAGFHPPAGWLDATRALIAQPPIEEGVVRVYITAGDSDDESPRVALLFEEMPIATTMGSTTAVTREFTPALPFGKTGNYWPHFLARPTGGGEAILCTPEGLLLGGAMANLFLILDDELRTPRQPVRRGIVREWIAAPEADLTRNDLSKATAAFLTNSRLGLCLLAEIDGRKLDGDARIDAIWERYRREVLRAG
jgi:branched-subunit amino acid aminotransferase/4-amino-4-deoxychorismate lyase